jgi:hypothetical protein
MDKAIGVISGKSDEDIVSKIIKQLEKVNIDC